MVRPEGGWLSIGRKVLRSWLLQGIGVYAVTEILIRIVLESGFIFLLYLAGLAPIWILVGWLLLHTAAWLLIYSGFGRVWTLLQASTEVSQISAFLDRTQRTLERSPSVRAAFLRGRKARGELNERSDIAIWLVPGRWRLFGVLRLWALRLASVLHRIPLEADLLDTERYVPFIAKEGAVIVLKEPPPDRQIARRWSSRGILVTFSGMDGSGKTTVANQLVQSLREGGFDAVYFYGHRLAYLRSGTRRSFAIAFKSFWKRVGRSISELQHRRFAKAAFDLATVLDYVIVLWRLAILLRPRRIVIVDRYVADVIAYLRTLGPGRLAEPFLIGISFVPEIPLLFDIGPKEALGRKQEQSLRELEKYFIEYSDLKQRLHLVSVDARPDERRVRSSIEDILAQELGISIGGERHAVST